MNYNELFGHMEHLSIDLGPIMLTFYWENRFAEVVHALGKWLGSELENRSGEVVAECKKPHLKFVISASSFDDIPSASSPQEVIRTWAWDARLVYAGGGETLYTCKPRTTFKKMIVRALPQSIVRFANPLFNSYWELQAGYLLYHVVLRAMHTKLQAYNVAFAHAAALSDSFGSAVMIAGAGGIGKTTTAANLISTGYWKLIADDFVLISEEGEVYDSRLPAHIYSYHAPVLKQLGVSQAIFSNWLDRQHWKIYSMFKKGGAVRRIFLPGKTHQGKIRACFVVDVIAKSRGDILVQDISHEVAARSSARYTLAELNLLESQKRLDSTATILAKALRGARCYRIAIGEDARGPRLANTIVKMVKEGLE